MTLALAARLAPGLARAGVRYEVQVPHDRLLLRLGCAPEDAPSRRLLRGIERAVGQVAEHAAPALESRTFPVRREGGRPRVGFGPVLESRKLGGAIASCDRIVVFGLTLGKGVDGLIHRVTRQNVSQGFILDAAASVAVEAFADAFQADVGRALPVGEAATLRFSPGYCDWSIREQEKVFSLLPPDPAGIYLSPDFLMSPRKSISGVIGLGPRQAVEATGCPCRTCGRGDCDHRRAPWLSVAAERVPGRGRASAHDPAGPRVAAARRGLLPPRGTRGPRGGGRR
jgi:hypothetical protein